MTDRLIFKADEIDAFVDEVRRRRLGAELRLPAACLSMATSEGQIATGHLALTRDSNAAVIYAMCGRDVVKIVGLDASSPELRKELGERLARHGLLFNDTAPPSGGFTPRSKPSSPEPASFDKGEA